MTTFLRSEAIPRCTGLRCKRYAAQDFWTKSRHSVERVHQTGEEASDVDGCLALLKIAAPWWRSGANRAPPAALLQCSRRPQAKDSS